MSRLLPIGLIMLGISPIALATGHIGAAILSATVSFLVFEPAIREALSRRLDVLLRQRETNRGARCHQLASRRERVTRQRTLRIHFICSNHDRPPVAGDPFSLYKSSLRKKEN